ncbi:MAG: GNAT family N-acetyltransferase [Pseudonocardia sp.]|nr:GNAT family N-acetyltransferase [Pseudonocardia sp.]
MSAISAAQQLGVSLRRCGAAEARQLFKTVETVYRGSYVEAIASGNLFNSVEAFMTRFESYSARPGLDLVIAYHDNEPIGQTWGWPLPKNSRWWDGLKTKPEANFTDEDAQRTFALSEIMVTQEWTGKGVAHALHDALLSARRERRATLLVRPTNPARRAYEHWGWNKAGQLQPDWEDAPVFDVMIKELSNSD